ncbi:hypothetical protein chiPu_0004067 [Chiloscyllium punctatum]|uniref:Uncharacterized protein n=1 Tax=Chiloscyllium punctatum TaxID=137246 RepID=A0A401S5J2_CHIPU|nr:hypothetical protein [Chiloscyllium punctatum]
MLPYSLEPNVSIPSAGHAPPTVIGSSAQTQPGFPIATGDAFGCSSADFKDSSLKKRREKDWKVLKTRLGEQKTCFHLKEMKGCFSFIPSPV